MFSFVSLSWGDCWCLSIYLVSFLFFVQKIQKIPKRLQFWPLFWGVFSCYWLIDFWGLFTSIVRYFVVWNVSVGIRANPRWFGFKFVEEFGVRVPDFFIPCFSGFRVLYFLVCCVELFSFDIGERLSLYWWIFLEILSISIWSSYTSCCIHFIVFFLAQIVHVFYSEWLSWYLGCRRIVILSFYCLYLALITSCFFSRNNDIVGLILWILEIWFCAVFVFVRKPARFLFIYISELGGISIWVLIWILMGCFVVVFCWGLLLHCVKITRGDIGKGIVLRGEILSLRNLWILWHYLCPIIGCPLIITCPKN